MLTHSHGGFNMEIWIVTVGQFNSQEIRGAFSTEALANEYAKVIRHDQMHFCYVTKILIDKEAVCY